MRTLSALVIGVAGLAVVTSGSTAARPPVAPQAEASAPAANERIERALQNRLACLGCHRIGDDGGAIGPTLNGLSARVDISHVEAMIRDPAGTVPGTLMPRQRMLDRDVRRLAEYLMSRTAPGSDAPVQPEAPAPIPSGRETDGEALYARHCASCHGAAGGGDGWNAPALPVPPTAHSDADLMSTRPDDTLYDGIAGGAWVLDGSPRMPAFADLLTPEQIRALVAHIRTLCACEGPEWSRGGVR